MTQEQFYEKIFEQLQQMTPALKELAKPSYTLTQAQDWSMLLTMFGIIAFLLMIVIAMIGFLWKTTSSRLEKDNGIVHLRITELEKEHKDDMREAATEFKTIKLEIDKCRAHCYYGRRREDVEPSTD